MVINIAPLGCSGSRQSALETRLGRSASECTPSANLVRQCLFPAAAITRQASKAYLKIQILSRAWLRNALLISPASPILIYWLGGQKEG